MIESVCWAYLGDRIQTTSTGPILIGSQEGVIYEACLEPTDEYFKREEKYLKQVFTLPAPEPITGIHFESFPESSKKFMIVATTAHWIYPFVGRVLHHISRVASTPSSTSASCGPIFDNVFQAYAENMPGILYYPYLN